MVLYKNSALSFVYFLRKKILKMKGPNMSNDYFSKNIIKTYKNDSITILCSTS